MSGGRPRPVANAHHAAFANPKIFHPPARPMMTVENIGTDERFLTMA
jgi:hypothetical protein